MTVGDSLLIDTERAILLHIIQLCTITNINIQSTAKNIVQVQHVKVVGLKLSGLPKDS